MSKLALATSIPKSDAAEFAALPSACKAEIFRWMRGMERLNAGERIGVALVQLGAAMGLSAKRTRALYDAFRHTGDWRVFINRAKYQPVAKKLPAAFEEHCIKLREQNQRDKGAAAHRALIRAWQACQPIPGYERPADWPDYRPFPPATVTGLPAGWSLTNFQRIKSSKIERTAIQQGLGYAIAKHAPKVYTTRKNLWVGSHYMFDDVKHDLFTYVLNANQVARVWEFGCLDVFSASRFAWGSRPSVERADGKYDGLKGEDMRLLVASVFYNTGYSPHGTVCMTEHGTAAMPDDLVRLLSDFSGGLITMSGSGMTGKEQALSGMWCGRGGGNPRHKSPLEAFHNLMHNETAALLGQTGLSVDRRPEHLHGLLDYADDICKAMLQLPPQQAAKLMLPMLEYHSEFLPIRDDLYRLINGRIDHDLEGWVEAGNLIAEYRANPDSEAWVPQHDFLKLPPAARMALSLAAQQDRRCRRARYLSPAEVYSVGARNLIRIPPYVCAQILGDRYAAERKVINGYIEFEDKLISPIELRYESLVTLPDGGERNLTDRETYKTIVNPFDPEQLFVHNAKGGYIGLARRDHRVDRADEHAIHVAQGRVGHRIASQLAGVRERHADTVERITVMQEHNRRVIAGLPTTPEELAADRAATRRIRSEQAAPEDFMPTPAEPLHPAPAQPAESDDSFDITDFIPNQPNNP